MNLNEGVFVRVSVRPSVGNLLNVCGDGCHQPLITSDNYPFLPIKVILTTKMSRRKQNLK